MMDTQWDFSGIGRSGLKYQVLFDLMDRMGMSKEDAWETFNDIRFMEDAALAAMRTKPA